MKELTFPGLFRRGIDLWPHADAVWAPNSSATRTEHATRVLRLADALQTHLGCHATTPIGILAGNRPEFVEILHAAFLGAAIAVPLNTRFSPHELEHVLKDAECRLLFADAEHEATLATLAPKLGITVIGLDPPVEPAATRLAMSSYEELVASGRARYPAAPCESSIASIQYTGGTTGLPKGVVHDQRSHVLNLYHLEMTDRLHPGETMVRATPLWHAGGVAYSLYSAMAGVRLAILPRFDAPTVVATLDELDAAAISMVPTTLHMLLDALAEVPDLHLPALRTIICGGSPTTPDLLRRAAERLPNVAVSPAYGSTEAGLLVSMLTPSARSGAPVLDATCAGWPAPGISLSVRDEAGNALPVGAVGELWIRGGNMFREYKNNPDETARALHQGWYRSGDAARLDGHGRVYIVDRIKDMMISGGENVYPAEVEAALSAHADVAQCAVIGVPDKRWGEAVHGVVVLHPGRACDPEDLRRFARTRIAGYKVPKTIEFRDALPLSAAMKPLRRTLREQWSARADAAPAAIDDNEPDAFATASTSTGHR